MLHGLLLLLAGLVHLLLALAVHVHLPDKNTLVSTLLSSLLLLLLSFPHSPGRVHGRTVSRSSRIDDGRSESASVQTSVGHVGLQGRLGVAGNHHAGLSVRGSVCSKRKKRNKRGHLSYRPAEEGTEEGSPEGGSPAGEGSPEEGSPAEGGSRAGRLTGSKKRKEKWSAVHNRGNGRRTSVGGRIRHCPLQTRTMIQENGKGRVRIG